MGPQERLPVYFVQSSTFQNSQYTHLSVRIAKFQFLTIIRPGVERLPASCGDGRLGEISLIVLMQTSLYVGISSFHLMLISKGHLPSRHPDHPRCVIRVLKSLTTRSWSQAISTAVWSGTRNWNGTFLSSPGMGK